VIRRLEEARRFANLPRLAQPIEQAEVPEHINARLRTFCDEVNRLYEKVQTLFVSLHLKEPRPAKIHEEEPAENPLQTPVVLMPLNLFTKGAVCSVCGTESVTPCRQCMAQFCRVCFYSSVHTCDNKE
jgi:hypothetical protein